MAKFLNTRKAVSEIEDLIKTADQTLILISPYLKLSKDFKELLSYRNSKDKVTTIIFGKQELNPDEFKFLQGIQFVSLWSYYWTFLKRGGKSPIFVFSHDIRIHAFPALTQI